MRTTLLLLLFLSCFTTFSALGQSRIPGFALHNRVGVQVDEPTDVAIDSENNIYFVSGTVKKFRYHEFLGTEYLDYVPEGLNKENYGNYDIALDQHDNLYVVSYTYSKVAKFSPEGRLQLEFGTTGEAPGQFRLPEGIAVNSKDEIYVADTGNRRIQKFDKTGQLLQVIPLDPTTGNYFDAPLSIDFDGDNNLYLLHNPENKIVKYSPEGEKLIEFGNKLGDTTRLETPWKLAVDRNTGQIYISDERLKSFNVYSSTGELEYSIKYVHNYQHASGYKNSIAITSEGDIILATEGDQNDGHISIFDKTGGGSYSWGNLWQNKDLNIDNEGNVYLLDEIGRITKFNEWGEFVMTFGNVGEWRANHPNIIIKYPKAITSDLFNNLYVLRSPGLSGDTTAIYKLNQNGTILGVYYDLLPSTSTYTDLAVDAAGNMYVADFTGGQIHKISSDSRYLATIGSLGFGPGQIWMPLALAIDNTGILHVLDYNGGRVQQFDASGNFIRQFGKFSQNDGGPVSKSDLALDSKGNIHVASNLAQRRYWVFNAKGDLLHEILDNKVNLIATDRLGTNLIIDDDQADGYSHYMTNEYETPQSIIKGVVYDDANNNCIFDEGERTLSGIVVATNPGPYFAITDKNGSYALTVTPAEYTLHTMLPQQAGKTITATCPAPDQGYPVTISDPGQVIQQINFGNKVDSPAHLSVSVSSTRRRRCFESTTVIRYGNSGFSPAPDAKVYLQLPKEVELLSADKPYTRLSNGTYVFSVGTLVGGKSGTITIEDIVTCGDESVRNRTVCTRAWITPSNNAPAKPTPTVSISARCDAASDMIRFVLRNTGSADMDAPELFRKYANGELSSLEQFRLAAGDSMVLWVPSMGYTWRLEADQPEGNGDNTKASVSMEPCRGLSPDTTVTSSFVNLMPADDEEAEKSEECMLITDSYDPNDKLVTPIGRTEENYTPTNTAHKYKIRFQNTGTDVAYRVVVVDTLSEHLDLSTLLVGAASHPSRFEVSGKGRPVLTWTFENIMLPDSTADEPGSHGYILFSIKPKADLAEKTLVENFADIFFDFNSPIRTNVTQNRIYDMPPVVNEKVRVNLEDVLATPAIAAFSPAAGRQGSEITLTGRRFASRAADNKVYVNGKAATVVSASPTELRVLVPAGSSTGRLKVVTPDGGVNSTEMFEVYQPPVLSSFSPEEGVVGLTVTITGEHLQAGLIEGVKLGLLDCQILSHTSNAITVQVPAGAVTGNFEISTKGGEVRSASSYTVWHSPAITGLSKQTDIVGASIMITGENFASDKARNSVLFGAAQAQVLEATPQQLVVRVPELAASGSVTVETPGGRAASATVFEVIPGPKFTAMQPAKGAVGAMVEITGQHFGIMDLPDRIEFNGEPAFVLEATDDRYKVRVPRGARTGKVTISGYGGKAQSTADFVVEELAPADAIIVYPNPNNGRFTINLQHADFDVQLIEVYDAIGKRLYQTHITGPRPETVEVNLPSAKSGIYFLQLQTQRGLITKKLTLF